MTTPDPRLEEIEGRYQVPWLVSECSPESPASVYEEADGLETICCIPGYYSPEAQNHLARQIAAAPADVAYLLAELRKAQDKLARVEAACDRIINNEDGHKPPGPPHPTREQAIAVRIRAAVADATGGGE